MLTSATDTFILLRAFADELARCGMRHACTSPGSRSTPLVLSLVHHPRLHCYSHVDERAAGFFALGLAKASGVPAAVACTSGTATAELLPAVVEAHEARVPLLVLTADRPPELREVGAGQTIDQIKLYGAAAKWFFEVGTHPATLDRVRWMRSLACRAFAATLEQRPGAVHLNFPLREPLVVDGPLPADLTARADGSPYVRRSPAPVNPDASGALRELIGEARRGVVVAGRHERTPSLGGAAAEFCARSGWPLLADPLSGARRGSAAIAYYDALLRDEGFAASHRPELVIRVGDLPTSKPLRSWLASIEARQVLLDVEGAWQDPSATLTDSLALEPVSALAECEPLRSDPEWLARWQAADIRAARAIGVQLGGERLTEPAVAAELGAVLPAEATVFVASSMPVRDVETFWPARAEPPRVLSNRGANGIDGTVSSALGVAAASEGPVVLLIGDVALAHDLGGLLGGARLGLRLTIVLLDNGGGGIFDFLAVSAAPLAQRDDAYTDHIATPVDLDHERLAALFGYRFERVGERAELRSALERGLKGPASTIIEVVGDRVANVALHRRIWSAVSEALVGGDASVHPPD